MAITLIVLLLLGIFIGIPIAVALGGASTIALILFSDLPYSLIVQRIYVGLDSFPLLAAPLFLLAGGLMETGGISLRITNLASALIGHVRGGLGMVVVLGTMIFSGISGSSTADTAAIGSVMIPNMVRRGYSPAFATAVVAAAGGMGILIPPCIIMVIYGLLTNTSVAALFLGGVVPGLVMGGTMMVMVWWMAKRQGLPVERQFSVGDVVSTASRAGWALMMPVIILGGILLGWFTVTEAAVVAVVYGAFVALFVYRELKWSDLPRILVESGATTGAVMIVIGMAAVFAWLLTSQQVPLQVAQWLAGISTQTWFFLLLINIAFLLIGAVFEVTAALIMTVPILMPLVAQYNVDPVHFGVLLTANLGIGMVTPPVGVCLYVACGISKAPLESVIKPLAPLLGMMIATLILITYIPEITLYLPKLMLGYTPSR
ncbi:MAG: TRAP transporter large permease [Variibacter sp.]